MLIIKVCINENQIDEIQIQNTGEYSADGAMIYTIRQPEGFDNIPIIHFRENGAIKLIEQVISILCYKGYECGDN